jgi:hypothetical protein
MAPIAAPTQEIVRPPLHQVAVGAGVCRSCVKAPGCTVPRSPDHIVRSCDEFEGADGPRSDHASLTAASSVFSAGISAGAGAPEFKGLCAQCSRRATCAYPKPAGGVWHCDELA